MNKSWKIVIPIFALVIISALVIPLVIGNNRYGDSYEIEGTIKKVEKTDNGYLLYVDNRDFYNSDECLLVYISEIEMKMSREIKQKTQIDLEGLNGLDDNLSGSWIRANCRGYRSDVINDRSVFVALNASIYKTLE